MPHTSLPNGPRSPDYGFSCSHPAHVQLFLTLIFVDGGCEWDASELSPHPRGLCASSLSRIPFLRLCRLHHLQKGHFFSRRKGQRSVEPLAFSRRPNRSARSPRLLWVDWAPARCSRVRHMLRTFSASGLPR